MPYYETVFMARQDLSETQVKDITEKYSKVLTDQGAKILKTENWGLRSLAYRINKSRKAHYVLLEVESEGAAVIELERLLGLDEEILRSLTTRLEEATDGPSPIMAKPPSRDNRDGDRSSKPRHEKEAA